MFPFQILQKYIYMSYCFWFKITEYDIDKQETKKCSSEWIKNNIVVKIMLPRCNNIKWKIIGFLFMAIVSWWNLIWYFLLWQSRKYLDHPFHLQSVQSSASKWHNLSYFIDTGYKLKSGINITWHLTCLGSNLLID